jgi:hypothetical protein
MGNKTLLASSIDHTNVGEVRYGHALYARPSVESSVRVIIRDIGFTLTYLYRSRLNVISYYCGSIFVSIVRPLDFLS